MKIYMIKKFRTDLGIHDVNGTTHDIKRHLALAVKETLFNTPYRLESSDSEITFSIETGYQYYLNWTFSAMVSIGVDDDSKDAKDYKEYKKLKKKFEDLE